jgi:hypothetical protein
LGPGNKKLDKKIVDDFRRKISFLDQKIIIPKWALYQIMLYQITLDKIGIIPNHVIPIHVIPNHVIPNHVIQNRVVPYTISGNVSFWAKISGNVGCLFVGF